MNHFYKSSFQRAAAGPNLKRQEKKIKPAYVPEQVAERAKGYLPWGRLWLSGQRGRIELATRPG